MTQYKRPGTFAEEVLLPNQATGGSTSDFVAAFVGSNARGPITPTFVSSWSEYTSYFGGFDGVSYLPYALFQYFGNGGRAAYVCRAVHTDAVVATRTLVDRAGSPVSTLRVDAVNAGAWGNGIYFDVLDGSTGRFDLIVYSGGTATANIVERWNDLSMVNTDSRYAVTVVNDPSALGQGSLYIKLADLASGTTAPGDNPAVQAGTQLASGADGGSVTQTDLIGSSTAAVNQLDVVANPLVLNLPGVTTAATIGAVADYAATRGDVFVVIDPQSGRTASQLVSDAQTTAAAITVNLSYAAVYGPWIYVNDPAVVATGVLKLVPPGGAVVGQMAATVAQTGVWKAPAGISTPVLGAVALETKFTPSDLDSLNSASTPVNAIRNVPGAGICIFGVRTMKTSQVDRYVSARRTLIYLKSALRDLTRYAVFEANDDRLWTDLTANVTAFLTAFWQQGGLSGGQPDNAFYVKCDSTLNTPSQVQAGYVNLEVGVALEYPAEFVVIRLGQFDGGAAVTDSTNG